MRIGMRRSLVLLNISVMFVWMAYFVYTLVALYHLSAFMSFTQISRWIARPVTAFILAVWLSRQPDTERRILAFAQLSLLIAGCWLLFPALEGPNPAF